MKDGFGQCCLFCFAHVPFMVLLENYMGEYSKKVCQALSQVVYRICIYY